MQLQFLTAAVGPMRKAFGVEGGIDKAYPKASKVTTHDEDVSLDAAGLAAYRELLAEYAAKGASLYKGITSKPLLNQSRKGLTDSQRKTNLLILDIDGLRLPNVAVPPSVTDKHVRTCAEAIVSLLPAPLNAASYVAVASSSFGRKDDQLNMHLHFFLAREVVPAALKTWIRGLNVGIEAVEKQLSLTPSMQSVKSTIDPCLAENSRIVYIAPPEFGPDADNPFADDRHRIVLVDKGEPVVDLHPLLAETNATSIAAKIERKRKDLLRVLGISPKEHRTTRLKTEAGEIEVITNPHHIQMNFVHADHQYARYNVNNGDSNAYWVELKNPLVVHCFKPDEKPFLFEQANKDMYDWHVREFGGPVTKMTDDAGRTRNITPLLFQDFDTNNLYRVEYDQDEDELVRLAVTNKDNAEHWLREYGMPMPDTIPTYYREMQPKMDRCFDAERRLVNMFSPTRFMRHKQGEELRADLKTCHALHGQCPTIYTVVSHMLNYDDESIARFLNWLAFIYQYREKAKTAWLLHGTQGTGKGLFFHRVLKPLFGQHAMVKTLERIADDQFNAWEESALLVLVDEFNVGNASSGVSKTASRLKNMITEPSTTIRKMRTDQIEAPSYSSFLFATNDIGALNITPDDRRWNIAPRQEGKLVEVLPQLHTDPAEVDRIIDAELADFSAFLRSFRVARDKVQAPMAGEAKREAIEAAMDSTTRFFRAVMAGELAEFLPELLARPNELLQREQLLIQGVKSILRRWVSCCNKGTAHVPLTDLRVIYSYRAGKDINQNAFSRMLTSHAVKSEQTRRDYLDKSASNVRGVSVNWVLPEAELLALQAQLGQVPGVAPIDPSMDAAS